MIIEAALAIALHNSPTPCETDQQCWATEVIAVPTNHYCAPALLAAGYRGKPDDGAEVIYTTEGAFQALCTRSI